MTTIPPNKEPVKDSWAEQLALALSALLENPGGPFEADTAKCVLESYWRTRFTTNKETDHGTPRS